MLEAIDKAKAEIFELSRQIWQWKEPGLTEIKSSALLADTLAGYGFSVRRGITGIDPVSGEEVEFSTAFIAEYEGIKNGPAVGIMVEYDALPNGHSCGHNLIAAAGCAAALALREALKEVSGKVVVYGTPAEETLGSKPQMLAAGLMKGIDVMFASHGANVWSTELNVKALLSPRTDDDPLKDGLVFLGKAAHASDSPEKGRSALDAAMLAGLGIEFLREHMLETDRIHYVISDSGKFANVVPDYARIDLMLRANTAAELKLLTERIEKIIEGAALMTETAAVYTWDFPLLNAVPVPRLWRFTAKTAADAGVSKARFRFNMPAGASTDAGNVGYEIPMANIWFPVTALPEDQAPALHSDAFRDAAVTDYAMNNSLSAGKIIALSAYRLLADHAALRKIKGEFAKNKQAL